MSLLTCLLLLALSTTKNASALDNKEETTIFIPMPPVQPTMKDEYICFAQELEMDEAYFHLVDTKANKEDVHHAGIGFCDGLVSKEPIWTCTNMTGKLCTGPSVTVGGWDDLTKNNGIFKLPENVGFKLGKKSSLKYVIFEVHFRGPVKDPSRSAANVTLVVKKTPPKFHYQMYLLANVGYIPARSEHGFFSEVACPWSGPSVYAYSYVIHTHHYGVMVEGFLIRGGRWIMLGSHLSIGREKKRYNVPGGPIEIRDGDILAARCLYINKKDQDIKFGHGIDDEMCNFLIDFAYDPAHEDRFDKIIACNVKTPNFSFCNYTETVGIC